MLASLSSLQSDLRERSGTARRGRRLEGAAFAAGLLLVAIAVSSCGAARPIRYYQLNVPEAAPAQSAEPLPITLVLGQLTTSHLYREDRIVFGEQGEGMGTYEYQRWAEPPTEMIHAILLRDLRNTRRFREVYSVKSAVHGDYVLHGQLYDFKEVSVPNLVARVSFELQLRDAKKGITVWNMAYRQDEPVTVKEPSAVVAALDKNIHRGLDQAVSGIDQYFAAHPPQPPAAQN
ncbi:MAG: ABC-type transport auxiliary lipoprotein family protein [Candidatus Acidiferrum sp.]